MGLRRIVCALVVVGLLLGLSAGSLNPRLVQEGREAGAGMVRVPTASVVLASKDSGARSGALDDRSAYTSSLPSSETGAPQMGKGYPGVTSSEYNVTFSESGLPSKVLANAGWTVALGGTLARSRSSSLTVPEPNGTYPYVISGPANYRIVLGSETPSPWGNLTVSGGAVGMSVNFSTGSTAVVSANVSGLPPTMKWCIGLGDYSLAAYDQCSTNPHITLENLTPSSYVFWITSPLPNLGIKVWMLHAWAVGIPEAGPNGTFSCPLPVYTLHNHLEVTFSSWYLLTFNETGLPLSSLWGAFLSGGGFLFFWLFVPAGTPIAHALPNGTYSFRLDGNCTKTSLLGGVCGNVGNSVSPETGHLVIHGSNLTITAHSYPISFIERGLPSGTNWSVTLNGQTLKNTTSGTSGTIVFYEGSGHWSYKIGLETGYTHVGTPGAAKVIAGPITIMITFRAKTGHLSVTPLDELLARSRR